MKTAMPGATIREPAVAGSFYPRARAELEGTLERLFGAASPPPVPERALGAVVPHAGYVYSGGVAARVYARISVPERIVILAPNHTGLGVPLSLYPPGPGAAWRTPLGLAPIDEPLSHALRARCELEPDLLAHAREHAGEVQVPFIQRVRPDARIAAIVIGTHDPRRLERLGRGIAAALDDAAPEALIVASSDMNHYEPHARTLEKDELAIERILALDPAGLLETCIAHDISMCGVAPTAAMLWAALARGATRASLVDHRTSGEAFGDYDRVVGYAGIVVS
jgi:AmmeMemoRadiSam system protein B